MLGRKSGRQQDADSRRGCGSLGRKTVNREDEYDRGWQNACDAMTRYVEYVAPREHSVLLSNYQILDEISEIRAAGFVSPDSSLIAENVKLHEEVDLLRKQVQGFLSTGVARYGLTP